MLCLRHVKLQFVLLSDVATVGWLLKQSHLSSKTSPWVEGLRSRYNVDPYHSFLTLAFLYGQHMMVFLCEEQSYISMIAFPLG